MSVNRLGWTLLFVALICSLTIWLSGSSLRKSVAPRDAEKLGIVDAGTAPLSRSASVEPLRVAADPVERPNVSGRSLSGTVVGPLGEPVYARVSSLADHVMTDSLTGAFGIKRPASATLLQLEAPGYHRRTLDIGESQDDLGQLVLQCDTKSLVRVTIDGAPVAGAIVALWPRHWITSPLLGDRLRLPFKVQTGLDGVATVPGVVAWTAFAWWRGMATESAIIPRESDRSLVLRPSFRARVMSEGDFSPEGILVRTEYHGDLLLPMDPSACSPPLWSKAEPICVILGSQRLDLGPTGDMSQDREDGGEIRHFMCTDALQPVLHCLDSSNQKAIPFVLFRGQAGFDTTSRKISSNSSDGRHTLPRQFGGDVWVSSPGYQSEKIQLPISDVLLRRDPGSVHVMVVGVDAGAGPFFVRNGLDVLFCGCVSGGMLGPFWSNMLPCKIENKDRRVVGVPVATDGGEWILDVTRFGAIRIVNLHELMQAYTGIAVGAWNSTRFCGVDEDTGLIRWLEPGDYHVGYAASFAGKVQRLIATRVMVERGGQTDVVLAPCIVVRGQVKVVPQECRDELVYFPVWRDAGMAEIFGMDMPAREDVFCWTLPDYPNIAIAVSDSKKRRILDVLPLRGGECRCQLVVVQTDVRPGDPVTIHWRQDGSIGNSWETTVGPDGGVDVGWMPVGVRTLTLGYRDQVRVVDFDGPSPRHASFRSESTRK
jgi:hypothetical protein